MRYIQKIDTDLCVCDAADFVEAAGSGEIDRVRQFLDKGIHPDSQGFKGWTALRWATVHNNYLIVLELLTRGASVDATNYTGQTALMMASTYGHHDIASLLLFFGADPNRVNAGGHTALMIAAGFGYPLVTGVLLDHRPKVDFEKTDPLGKTALDLAEQYGHVGTAKLLRAAMGIADAEFDKHHAGDRSKHLVFAGEGA